MDRYHEGQRRFQDEFDTRRLADRLAEGTSDRFDDRTTAFIESRDMVFVASTGPGGVVDCSYKGGDPGFVRVVDEHTLAFASFDGNGMFRTLGNLSVNAAVGLLFIDFESGNRLRVNGQATVEPVDPGASPTGAQRIVRVQADAIFANCRRYVHEYHKVAASPFVPREDVAPPVPDWKRDPWFDGTLAAGDPAHDATNPSAPAIPTF
jgi:hypothetical protein